VNLLIGTKVLLSPPTSSLPPTFSLVRCLLDCRSSPLPSPHYLRGPRQSRFAGFTTSLIGDSSLSLASFVARTLASSSSAPRLHDVVQTPDPQPPSAPFPWKLHLPVSAVSSVS
ncbi:hypothetical protein S245_023549, partial [Arachis hypogaea]